MTLIRINKYLADQGVASRREADRMISEGMISLNGKTVTELGTKVDLEKDVVSVKGSKIQTKAPEFKYIVLHKPRGVVSTVRDSHAEKTVVSMVNSSERLYPVGRLDKESYGLVLLTNDGELAYRLTHPKYHIPKTYRVKVKGKIRESTLERLRKGVYIENELTSPADVRVIKSDENITEFEIVLYEGKKREIRLMCASLHLFLVDLKRVSIGSLELGNLESGKYRELSEDEIVVLKKTVGLG
jgi:23S rRNA pseudouridine2605 synthase